MKCKPGDLALVIAGHRDNLGKVVTCIELVNGQKERPVLIANDPIWRIDRPLRWRKIDPETKKLQGPWAKLLPFYPDYGLMPLRPPGEISVEFTQEELLQLKQMTRKPPHRVEEPCRDRS